MRLARVAATATAMSLVGAATLVATPAAHAATPGVGTSAATSSLLDVAVGQLLNLKVLADDARATIDPSIAQPEAFSKLNALSLTSALPAPLNNISLPVVESRSPNGNANVAGPGLNLGSLLPNIAGVTSILGGAMQPATLTSAVDANGARSALTSSLGNINLVGGLISATGLSSTLGTNAKGAIAEGNRSIKLDSIKVLDLGALLNGLGLPLANLPLGAVSGILSGLGLGVAGVPTSMSLEGFVDQLNTVIDGLQAQLEAVVGGVVQTALGTVSTGILGGLGLNIPVINNPVATVNSVLDTVQGLLTNVLKTALNLLDGVSLLSVQGIELGTVTKAGDTVANSVSDIVAKIGSIKIGGLTLPGLDLGATLDQVNGLLNTVNNTIGGVLGSISPDLANLVKVNLFAKDSASGVTKDGGYIKSLAGVSALTAKITPPLNLGAILGGLTAGNGIGSLLTGLGGTLPVLDTVMGTLNGLVGGVTSVLTEGATIKLASVTSGASFTTPVASTNGTLPRTGGTAQMALLGMAMAIAAIGARRFVLANRVNA